RPPPSLAAAPVAPRPDAAAGTTRPIAVQPRTAGHPGSRAGRIAPSRDRTQTMTDTTTTPPQDEAASHEAPAEHKGFSFADMHLAVGDRLQIECPAGTGLGRAFVRVIGYVDHLSILVTAPVAGNRRIDLVENDLVVVRVFSRENAF